MGTMKTSISIFEYLDGLRTTHATRISDVEWAAASGIRRPTIPELRRRAKSIREGGKPTGRPCTVEKITLLFAGLQKLIGGDVLRRKILEIVEHEPSRTTRMVLLALIAAEKVDPETGDLLEQSLKIAIKNTLEK
jgi:hypothetical protein